MVNIATVHISKLGTISIYIRTRETNYVGLACHTIQSALESLFRIVKDVGLSEDNVVFIFDIEKEN